MEQSRLRAWNGFVWPWAHRCGDIILLGQSSGSHGRCGSHPGGYGWMDSERTWKGLLWDAGKRDWGLSKAGCRDFMLSATIPGLYWKLSGLACSLGSFFFFFWYCLFASPIIWFYALYNFPCSLNSSYPGLFAVIWTTKKISIQGQRAFCSHCLRIHT